MNQSKSVDLKVGRMLMNPGLRNSMRYGQSHTLWCPNVLFEGKLSKCKVYVG